MATPCVKSTERLYGAPDEVPPVKHRVEADNLFMQGNLMREDRPTVPLSFP